jgi:transketolase
MKLHPAQSAPAAAKYSDLNYRAMANAIRALSMDAVEKANSGHPGMPMGMADVATVLFSRYLKFDPRNPAWPDRDRFVLSAGHGSMLLYSLLWLTGYEKMTMEQLQSFRQLGSLTPGHPEVHVDCGIETTTGPLGQGISTAVGMALAERIMNARFGDTLVDHYTYVIASDGDLMEGISHEACALAGHLKLARLVVLYDDNGICIDGPTSLSYSDDVEKRFEAYGWHAQSVDGHDHEAIAAAIDAARAAGRPAIICCKTHIGYGAPGKQGTADSHGSPLGAKEIAGARETLAWPHEPFHIPDDVRDMWRMVGERSQSEYEEWALELSQNRYRDAFLALLGGDVSRLITPVIRDLKAEFARDKPKIATRKASGLCLEKLVPALPFLIGGSADLTGSNLTKVKGPNVISAENYDGQYIHYGVREHGMAAIMNGLALHGGFIPYGGTFLTFSDYCRPAIRLAALMKTRSIFVMTHDSIGLGEDGPTHQAVEHLAALRVIPNLLVMRPCDPVETAECWELALNNATGPSLLALTRQNLAPLRTDNNAANRSERGAYILADCDHEVQVTIMATGSEVEIAMAAKRQLDKEGIAARVASVPCLDLFEQQDRAYQDRVLGGEQTLKVAVEAAVRQSWDRWIGRDGIFIGMNGYGESAPYEQLYEHFGITAENIVAQVKAALGL